MSPRRNRRQDTIGLGSEQLPGFDLPDTPVGMGLRGGAFTADRVRLAPRPVGSIREKPVWSAYRGPRVVCFEGARLAHEHERGGLHAGHTVHARYRRKFKNEEHLLCGPCGAAQHAADGLTGPLPSTTRGVR